MRIANNPKSQVLVENRKKMGWQPGDRIKQYRIDEMIAQGGMGIVWSAWDEEFHRPVAVKAVVSDLVLHPEFKVRIQDEARRHQQLQHENIVSVLDVFETNGEICIVMEMIEGISLDRYIESKDNRRVSEKEAIPIICDVLEALNYAHKKAIVHRDVKPSNVLLNHDNRALLIDFGIALAVGEERHTRTGQTIGTPLFMSPEQITTPKQVYHTSDVYSVGCVLYKMLTGRAPFVKGEDGIGMADFAIQQAHVKMLPIRPKARVPELSNELDTIVMSALEKEPANRIPGCEEFIRLLEAIDPDTTGSVTSVQLGKRISSAKKIWLLIGIFLIILVLIFYSINL